MARTSKGIFQQSVPAEPVHFAIETPRETVPIPMSTPPNIFPDLAFPCPPPPPPPPSGAPVAGEDEAEDVDEVEFSSEAAKSCGDLKVKNRIRGKEKKRKFFEEGISLLV
jgi:hypothetical protein